MRIDTPTQGVGYRLIVPDEGMMLRLKGTELYTYSLATTDAMTLTEAAKKVDEVPEADVPRYDWSLIAQIEMIEAVSEALSATPSQDADWSADGGYLTAGSVVIYDGYTWQVIQTHKPQVGWEPDKVPALFRRLAAIDEPPDTVTEWVKPTGGHDAYQTGDKVTYQGKVYESLINANVWSPTEYAAGWKEVLS